METEHVAKLPDALILQGKKCSTMFSVRYLYARASAQPRCREPSSVDITPETKYDDDNSNCSKTMAQASTAPQKESKHAPTRLKTAPRSVNAGRPMWANTEHIAYDHEQFRQPVKTRSISLENYKLNTNFRLSKPVHEPRIRRDDTMARQPVCILKMKRQHSASVDKQVQKVMSNGVSMECTGNRNPSVARASQTASRREQFALYRRLQSYKYECNDSIGRINLNRRRVSVQLVHLRHKMAELAAVRALALAEESRGGKRPDVPATCEELFLRHKGYIPDVTNKDKRPKFPSLLMGNPQNITIR